MLSTRRSWRKKKNAQGAGRLGSRGLATGGRCFGYRAVRVEGEGSRLEVKTDEAEIIRRIFDMSAGGLSYKAIAHLLNAEGIQSPQPQKGRIGRSWCVSSVRHILNNRRYTGKVIWNTRRKVRVPGSGRRVFRPRPQSDWIEVDAPELRIVPEDLFAAVRKRRENFARVWGREDGTGLANGRQRQKYLFSGLLTCGECEGGSRLSRDASRTPERSMDARCTAS
jgi:site-specific DNA recombinase